MTAETPGTLARHIDHTLLKPDATEEEVRRLVAEAAEAGFACAMVPPCWVRLAAEGLEAVPDGGTGTVAATVIAFPLGYADARARVAESVQAVSDGARELDTVINLSFLKSGGYRRAAEDLAAWVQAMRALDEALVLKVIVETALLTDAEKRRAAELVAASGADFVKTSTGFGPGGATVEDVQLLHEVVAGRCRVKASGGIRDLLTARAMIAAGAARLGTSSGRAILEEAGSDARP
jgi:deoxyribose-phosphate aldolase